MTPPSPSASRVELGHELRRYREEARLLIADAATVLECSQSKVSRLENGKGVPRARDVRDLLDRYGVTSEEVRTRLQNLVLASQEDEWWREYEDVVRGELFAKHLLPFAEAEQEAVSARTFEPELFPGLLQAQPYIEAIASFFFPDSAKDDRDRFVQFRLRRQQVLRSWRTFEMVVGEAALVRVIGGPAVMGVQLETVSKALETELAHVDLRILPFDVVPVAAIGGPFVVLRFANERRDSVYIEGREGATFLTGEAKLDEYDRKFEELLAAALDRDASHARLVEARRRLQPPDDQRSTP